MHDALEALVSSRIRRTLLEHLLAHPHERFYLRGLAKELSLSVSPLRRELKRLERAGALKATPEGNMLFYEADPSAPIFQQVRQALAPAQAAPAPVQPAAPPPAAPQPAAPVAVGGQRQAAPSAQLALMLASGALAAVFALIAGVAYVSWKPQVAGRVIRGLGAPSSVTVVAPTASGMMRGARWRLVPGGFGGFGGVGGPAPETY